ncbi:MAG: hypothetical protein IKW50_06520 [Oscillospiraceae bacterium]|nr:hypothetical protein [Oscillospiraceae bacterium]
MSEVFMEVAAQAAGALLVAVISVAGAWLSAKIGRRQELASIAAATEEAAEAAKRVVLELQQTAVEGMKAARVDGKLSRAEVEQLGKLLLEKSLAQLSQPAKQVLEAAGKDVCAIIRSAGEAAVLAIKQQ